MFDILILMAKQILIVLVKLTLPKSIPQIWATLSNIGGSAGDKKSLLIYKKNLYTGEVSIITILRNQQKNEWKFFLRKVGFGLNIVCGSLLCQQNYNMHHRF